MRPDKWKKKRGRNSEKSEGSSAQEKKPEENVNINKSDSGTSIQKESEKSDVSKPVNVEGTAEKAKAEVPPILNLKRETDDLKETKKFSKRQIFSNWDKYDEPIVHEEEDEIHDDFGSLIQRNFSGDEHFKFKFQQQWEKEPCNINQDLFTLNLERLSSGLSCIPYYKRLNLPLELFSEEELQMMQNDAKAKIKDYENILKGEPAEPVTESLLLKFKECINDKAVNETIKNPNDNDVVSMQGIQEFPKEDYASPEEAVWDLDESQKEIQLVGDMKALAPKREENVLHGVSKTEIKEDINNQETEIKAIEKEDAITFDLPERIEVEKEQRKKRPSNRRREAANRSSNKIELSNNLPVNTAEEKCTVSDNVASKEEVPEKGAPEEVMKKTSPQEIKNDIPKKEPKVETLASNEKTSGSSLPLKKPVAPASTKKNRVEEDEELDSLLSLKEPSLPQYNVSHKAQDDEHEIESLATNVSSIVIHEKKENLEEWLDSMLDD